MTTSPGRPAVRAALLALAAAALAAGAGGCGGPAPTPPAASSRAAAAPASVGSSAAPTPGASSPTTAAAAATRTVTGMTAFRSPTGNITCYLAPVSGQPPYARCDLAQASWSVPPPPHGCALSWGGGQSGHGSVGVGARGAGVLCTGDALTGQGAQVLPYGSSLRLGDLVCSSRETGMTCQDDAGHGFVASRARVELS